MFSEKKCGILKDAARGNLPITTYAEKNRNMRGRNAMRAATSRLLSTVPVTLIARAITAQARMEPIRHLLVWGTKELHTMVCPVFTVSSISTEIAVTTVIIPTRTVATAAMRDVN